MVWRSDAGRCTTFRCLIFRQELIGLLEVQVVLVRRRDLRDMDSGWQVAPILPSVLALPQVVQRGAPRQLARLLLRLLLLELLCLLQLHPRKLLVAPFVRYLMLLMRKLLCALLLHNHRY